MTLIDGQKLADELLGEIYERGQASGLWEKQLEIGALTLGDIEFADGYDNALDKVYRQINKAPTVEAIPIEWIENWMNTKGVFAQYIGDMLNDWRKENEI